MSAPRCWSLVHISLLLALSWGGVRYPWGSGTVVLSAARRGGRLGAGFAARLATAAEPLIPDPRPEGSGRHHATTRGLLRHGHLHRPIDLRADLLRGRAGLTASQSGVALVPLMVGTVTGATLSGRSMLYFKRYKRVPLVMMGVSVACCAVRGGSTGAAAAVPADGGACSCCMSIGLGTILPLSTIAIQNTVEFHELGIATAAMNFFRSLGGALIVAAFGTIVLAGRPATGGASGARHGEPDPRRRRRRHSPPPSAGCSRRPASGCCSPGSSFA